MIDVFFCSVPGEDPVREFIAQVCLERWKREPNATVIRVTPSLLDCCDVDFQKERRVFADQEAVGPYYIVADDDCLLDSPPILDDCRAAMHFDFGVVALWPDNHKMGPWTSVPEGYKPYEDRWLLEHAAAGGIRFCRKGALETWPEPKTKTATYDGEHAEALRAVGMRTGYFKRILMYHLGKGRSTVR